jgi:hypothetical protein
MALDEAMKSLSFFSKYEENINNFELSTLVLAISVAHLYNSFLESKQSQREKHLGFMLENLKSFGLGK